MPDEITDVPPLASEGSTAALTTPVLDQFPPITGEQWVEYAPVDSPPAQWCAEALMPLHKVEPVAAPPTAVRSWSR
jgi:hypothetical protein